MSLTLHRLLLLLAASTVLVVESTRPDECQFAVPQYGASFDLSPLALASGSFYSLADQSNTQNHNFSYIFNVCENVELGISVPECARKYAQLSVPAWQILPNGAGCWALSNSSSPASYEWALIDDSDPTVGVSLTYSGGDVCATGAHKGSHRSLTLNLFCAPTVGALNELAGERVAEDPNGCAYELSADTLFGCPQECSVVSTTGRSFALCAGHGICQYDTDANVPKCFCNVGWSGVDCSVSDANSGSDSNTGIGALGVLLILLVIVLFALNLAAALLFLRLRAFKPQRELNQMDAEHLAAAGIAHLPDDSLSVNSAGGAGALNPDRDPEASLTRMQVGGVSGVFTIE